LGNGATAGATGSYSTSVTGGDLTVGAAAEHQPRQDDVLLSAEFEHPNVWLSGDWVNSRRDLSQTSQYSLSMHSTIISGADSLRLTGKTTSQSVIVVRAVGARSNDIFDILVNDQIAGSLVGEQPLPLDLPSYREYSLRIRPRSADLVAYDNSVRRVALYPGTVASVAWQVSAVTIRVARLVAPDGKPIANAAITGPHVWSQTDEDGYFQIEAPVEAGLMLTLQDGRSFPLVLQAGEPKDGIALLGPVICCQKTDSQLAAVAEPIRSTLGGTP
jgi:hypothetical protein